MIVHEVAVAADAADAADEPAEAAPARRARQGLQISGRHDGAGEMSDGTHPHGTLVEPGPRSLLGPRELPVHRCARDTQYQFPGTPQRNLRGKERALAHERLGAVDGIDQPDVLRLHRMLS